MLSMWLQEALAGTQARPALALDRRAAVAIVGGGLTGLWTALHLKEAEPSLEVVVLERDVCGSGASGRNAGFVLDWWAKLASFEHHCGVEGAARLAAASTEAIRSIEEFCATHAPRAQFRRAGWLWAASNAAQMDAWASAATLHERRGKNLLRPVGRDEAEALTGSGSVIGGVIQDDMATVHPGWLTVGLREAALAAGVEIYENTAVRAVDDGPPAIVTTDRGRVTADHVVLATNCWLSAVRAIRRSMFVVGSDIACTEPLPEGIEGPMTSGVGMTDSRMLLRYARATANGRLMVGLAGTAVVPGRRAASVLAGVPSPARVGRLRALYREMYPDIAARVPLTRSWTGPVDRSWAGIPFIQTLGSARNVTATAGYSGNGVGPAHLVGRMLASIATDRDDEPRELAALLPPRGGVPPAPVAYLGGLLVHHAVARKESLEDRGARIDALTRHVAGLAPSAVVPVQH